MTQSDNPATSPIISSSPIAAPTSVPPGTATTGAPVHKATGDTEEVYYEGSPLLRGELGRGFFWILIGLVLIALPILLRVFMDKWPAFAVTASAVVLGLILLFVPWVKAKTVRYRITNYRIDFQKGFLGRSIETIELWHVEDLRFHQSLPDRMLGIGTITIISKHPTIPVLVMRSLPNAPQIFKTLEQRVIAVKRASGVIKVDAGN